MLKKYRGPLIGLVCLAAAITLIVLLGGGTQNFADKYADTDLTADVSGIGRSDTYNGYLLAHADAGIGAEPVTVDVLDMLDILQKMQGELTTEERLDCCRRIMDLYQGEPYLPVGTVGDVIHASYLRKSYLQTAHAYADLLRERGDDGALIAACRQALRQDPLEEHLRAELMRALARQGRPDEAAQEYAQAVRFARQMLDSEPGEELQACRREIAGRAK